MAKQKDFLRFIRGLFEPTAQRCFKRFRTSREDLKKLTKTDPEKARKLMHKMYDCVIGKPPKLS